MSGDKEKLLFFSYKAVTKNGDYYSNDGWFKDFEELQNSLNKKQLSLIEFKRSRFNEFIRGLPLIGDHIDTERKLNNNEMLIFFREMSSMMKIGFTSKEAITYIHKNKTVPKVIRIKASKINEHLEKGVLFHEAIKIEGFPVDVCAFIKIGLASTNAYEALHLLTSKLVIQDKILKTWIGVLAYPVVFGAFIILSTIASIIWLAPIGKNVINSVKNGGDPMPPASEMLFYFTDNSLTIGLSFFALVFASYFTHKIIRHKNRDYRMWFGNVYNRIPFLGTIKIYQEYMNISSLLAMMSVSSFVQGEMISAIEPHVKNFIIADEINKIKVLVNGSGMTIGQAMNEIEFDSVITNSYVRGESVGKKEMFSYLIEVKGLYEEKIYVTLKVLQQSSEFLNNIAMYVLAIPILAIALIPQFDAIILLIRQL
jgi:type IV pilus assembly protein PilC